VSRELPFYGSTATVTATPSLGYSVASWSGAGTGNGLTRSIVVTGPASTAVTFSQNALQNQTVRMNPISQRVSGATISLNGPGLQWPWYASQSSASDIVSAYTDWQTSGYSGGSEHLGPTWNIEGSAESSSGLPITYSVVSGPATISGSTVTLTGVGTVTLQATQSGGVGLSPNGTNWNPASTQVSFSVVVPKVALNIEINTVGGSGAGGTVSPSAGVYYYNEGTVVPISASAFAGFNFTGWTGPVANTGVTSTTVTMTGP